MRLAGTESLLMDIFRQINREKVKFDFIYFTSSDCYYDNEIRSLGGNIYRIDSRNKFLRFLELIKFLRSVNDNQLIVHSHVNLANSLYLSAALIAGVKFRFSHSHSSSDIDRAKFSHKIYKALARFIIPWVSTKKLACSTTASLFLHGPGFENEIVSNGIDMSRFGLNPNREKMRADLLAVDTETLVMLQVGRLSPEKNHRLSLTVLHGLVEAKRLKAILVVVGEGSMREAIERQATLLGIRENVVFLGVRKDVPELMTVSDFLLLPSDFEGFGLVAVESQAAGLKCYASTNVPVEVDCDLGLFQRLGTENNVENWIENIAEDWVRNVPWRNSLIDYGLRFERITSKGFNIKTSVNDLFKLYNECVDLQG